MRRHLVTIIAITSVVFGLGAAPGGKRQADPLVTLLTPPMTAVARLVVLERWDPRLNALIQRAPAAEPLGSKWTSAAPAWQKARSSVGARLTLVLDLYASYGELPRLIRSQLDADFPGAEAAALLTVLKSPAGPSIINQMAETAFAAEAEDTQPGGPEIGSPEWLKHLSALIRKFRAGIGPEVPAKDASQADAASKFTDSPAGRKFSGLWMLVIAKAETSVSGAMNLMLFDDREAIMRDIAQAVASVK